MALALPEILKVDLGAAAVAELSGIIVYGHIMSTSLWIDVDTGAVGGHVDIQISNTVDPKDYFYLVNKCGFRLDRSVYRFAPDNVMLISD